ncbi:MAG: hypothetical protein AAGF15_02180 [Pseudomonadota bacterium]
MFNSSHPLANSLIGLYIPQESSTPQAGSPIPAFNPGGPTLANAEHGFNSIGHVFGQSDGEGGFYWAQEGGRAGVIADELVNAADVTTFFCHLTKTGPWVTSSSPGAFLLSGRTGTGGDRLYVFVDGNDNVDVRLDDTGTSGSGGVNGSVRAPVAVPFTLIVEYDRVANGLTAWVNTAESAVIAGGEPATITSLQFLGLRNALSTPNWCPDGVTMTYFGAANRALTPQERADLVAGGQSQWFQAIGSPDALAGSGLTPSPFSTVIATTSTPAQTSVSSPLDRGRINVSATTIDGALTNGRRRVNLVPLPSIDYDNGNAQPLRHQVSYALVNDPRLLTEVWEFRLDDDPGSSPGRASELIWRYPGEASWREFDVSSGTQTEVGYNHDPFAQDAVEIGYNLPYSLADADRLIAATEAYHHPVPSVVLHAGNPHCYAHHPTAGAFASDHDKPFPPAFEQKVFKLSDPLAQPADGLGKSLVVLASGVHASEDGGNWMLDAAVRLWAATPELRSKLDLLVYPILNVSGRYDGRRRGVAETAFDGEDPNRRFPDANPLLAEVIAAKAAFAADDAYDAGFAIDFHTAGSGGAGQIFFYRGSTPTGSIEDQWGDFFATRLGQGVDAGEAGVDTFGRLFRDEGAPAVTVEWDHTGGDPIGLVRAAGEAAMFALADSFDDGILHREDAKSLAVADATTPVFQSAGTGTSTIPSVVGGHNAPVSVPLAYASGSVGVSQSTTLRGAASLAAPLGSADLLTTSPHIAGLAASELPKMVGRGTLVVEGEPGAVIAMGEVPGPIGGGFGQVFDPPVIGSGAARFPIPGTPFQSADPATTPAERTLLVPHSERTLFANPKS